MIVLTVPIFYVLIGQRRGQHSQDERLSIFNHYASLPAMPRARSASRAVLLVAFTIPECGCILWAGFLRRERRQPDLHGVRGARQGLVCHQMARAHTLHSRPAGVGSPLCRGSSHITGDSRCTLAGWLRAGLQRSLSGPGLPRGGAVLARVHGALPGGGVRQKMPTGWPVPGRPAW